MVKGFGFSQFCVLAVLLAVFLAVATAPSSAQTMLCPTGTICVTAWQQDTPSLCPGCAYRTGANLTETKLTNSSIQNGTFGQLCSAQLDGQVYAQPLVVTNVQIPNQGTFDVAYVVTENDSVYAINATPPATGHQCQILLGPVNLLLYNFLNQPAMSAVDCHHVGGGTACTQTIGPTIGVLGTPVINIDTTNNTGTLYLVAEMQSGTYPSLTYYHFLHALDITTLAEGIGKERSGAPVQICPTGCGQYTSSSAFSKAHIQRPGLLFASCGSTCGNYIYASFSMMDGSGWPWHNGVVLGYNTASLSGSYFYFQTSNGQGDTNSYGGGIWMGGAAPAFGPDKNGKNWIYVTTGNGTYNPNPTPPASPSWGDSFLKLDPNNLALTADVTGYFTPADQFYRNDASCNLPYGHDIDYGSGGPMLIPDNELVSWPHLAVNGDKEGGLWFVDRTKPNGISSCAENTCFNNQLCIFGSPNNVQTYSTGTRTIHTSPAYWDYNLNSPSVSYMYVAAIGGQLFQYELCGISTTGPIDYTTCPGAGAPVGSANGSGAIKFSFGTTPAVSARAPDATNALVWAIDKTDGPAAQGTAKGILHAFDALSMTELYSSHNSCMGDEINPTTKRSVPTVANSYVYVGTESDNVSIVGKGTFYIFGLNRPAC
jgi:hypothetical protein